MDRINAANIKEEMERVEGIMKEFNEIIKDPERLKKEKVIINQVLTGGDALSYRIATEMSTDQAKTANLIMKAGLGIVLGQVLKMMGSAEMLMQIIQGGLNGEGNKEQD